MNYQRIVPYSFPVCVICAAPATYVNEGWARVPLRYFCTEHAQAAIDAIARAENAWEDWAAARSAGNHP